MMSRQSKPTHHSRPGTFSCSSSSIFVGSSAAGAEARALLGAHPSSAPSEPVADEQAADAGSPASRKQRRTRHDSLQQQFPPDSPPRSEVRLGLVDSTSAAEFLPHLSAGHPGTPARACHSSHSMSSTAASTLEADPWPMPQPTASGRRPPPRIFRRERLATDPNRLSYAETPSRGTPVESLMLSRELAGVTTPGVTHGARPPYGRDRMSADLIEAAVSSGAAWKLDPEALESIQRPPSQPHGPPTVPTDQALRAPPTSVQASARGPG